jgi:uncharacterized protein
MNALRILLLTAALALCACEPRKPSRPPPSSVAAGSAIAPSAAPGLEACPPGFSRALCLNRNLAALNNQLKQALRGAAARVSSEGVRILTRNQDDWLESQRVACGIDRAAAQLTKEQEDCIRGALSDRLKRAGQAVEKIGAYTFQRVEINESAPVDKSQPAAQALGELAPKAVMTAIAYPRLDAKSPTAEKFNALMKQTPRFQPGDQTEESVEYKIVYAGPDLISVRFNTYDMAVGAAHPNNAARAITFNMRTLARLSARDVFRPGSGWENYLTARSAQAINKALKDEDISAPTIAADAVRPTAIDPTFWLITEKALVVLFPPDTFAPAVLGGQEVTIPWKDLKRFLSPNAPAPIRA